MSDVLRVLREARELITPVERWTQGESARDGSGDPLDPRSIHAARWCGMGALQNCTSDIDLVFRARGALLSQGRRLYKQRSVSRLNDACGHEAILTTFDAAIAAEQAKTASPSP